MTQCDAPACDWETWIENIFNNIKDQGSLITLKNCITEYFEKADANNLTDPVRLAASKLAQMDEIKADTLAEKLQHDFRKIVDKNLERLGINKSVLYTGELPNYVGTSTIRINPSTMAVAILRDFLEKKPANNLYENSIDAVPTSLLQFKDSCPGETELDVDDRRVCANQVTFWLNALPQSLKPFIDTEKWKNRIQTDKQLCDKLADKVWAGVFYRSNSDEIILTIPAANAGGTLDYDEFSETWDKTGVECRGYFIIVVTSGLEEKESIVFEEAAFTYNDKVKSSEKFLKKYLEVLIAYQKERLKLIEEIFKDIAELLDEMGTKVQDCLSTLTKGPPGEIPNSTINVEFADFLTDIYFWGILHRVNALTKEQQAYWWFNSPGNAPAKEQMDRAWWQIKRGQDNIVSDGVLDISRKSHQDCFIKNSTTLQSRSPATRVVATQSFDINAFSAGFTDLPIPDQMAEATTKIRSQNDGFNIQCGSASVRSVTIKDNTVTVTYDFDPAMIWNKTASHPKQVPGCSTGASHNLMKQIACILNATRQPGCKGLSIYDNFINTQFADPSIILFGYDQEKGYTWPYDKDARVDPLSKTDPPELLPDICLKLPIGLTYDARKDFLISSWLISALMNEESLVGPTLMALKKNMSSHIETLEKNMKTLIDKGCVKSEDQQITTLCEGKFLPLPEKPPEQPIRPLPNPTP